jgi:hypothetical protein
MASQRARAPCTPQTPGKRAARTQSRRPAVVQHRNDDDLPLSLQMVQTAQLYSELSGGAQKFLAGGRYIAYSRFRNHAAYFRVLPLLRTPQKSCCVLHENSASLPWASSHRRAPPQPPSLRASQQVLVQKEAQAAAIAHLPVALARRRSEAALHYAALNKTRRSQPSLSEKLRG